jgi:RimJ/RimL family protein N-acetyltransferase
MTTEITLKNLTIHDASAVSLHVRQVYENTPRLNHVDNEHWLQSEYSATALKERISDHYSIGVYMEGTLIGTGFAHARNGLLSGIYVSRQGHGVGTLIIENLLAHLKKEQVTQAEASVHPSSAAMRHLLAKNGFIIQGVDPNRMYFPDVNFEIVTLTL